MGRQGTDKSQTNFSRIMDYKEKYEKALDTAKIWYSNPSIPSNVKGIFRKMFTELKNEGIKQWLIGYFQQYKKDGMERYANGLKVDDIITWLEQQDEKTDVDSSNLKTWKYIVDAVLTEKEGIGQYLDNPFTEEVAKKLQKRFGNIEQEPITDIPSKELIFSIWDLGNEWKRLTKGCFSEEHGTQLDYIQKHWHESAYYVKQAKQSPSGIKTVGESLDLTTQKECDDYNKIVTNLIMNSNTEDEKIRKALISILKSDFEKDTTIDGISVGDIITWLEEQGTPAKLSEEEQNKFAKGVLTSCAMSFIDYLDTHKYEGKMCVSNGECEDIENAFHNAMWDRLHRYYCKYIEKQGEKPQGKKKLEYTLDDVFDDLRAGLDPSPTQDTQKSTIEAKPKFNVGQWIVWRDKCYKVNYNGCGYELIDQNDLSTSLEYGTVDENAHLWNIIKDAKAGDILASKKTSCVLIFKDIDRTSFISYYNTSTDSNDGWNRVNFLPATKEQREFLFATMKKDGYKWDVNNKQLIEL